MTKTDDFEPEDLTRWDRLREEYFHQNRIVLEQYRRYCKFMAGNMKELEVAVADRFRLRGIVAANYINLVTRIARAELYYRNPQFLVEPPTSFADQVFTPSLARVETALLNRWAKETDMYTEMRRTLLDGLLGPRMVIKLGYTADIGIDEKLVLGERDHAQREDRAFLAGVGRPRVMRLDLHSVHIDQHERTLKLQEQGHIMLPQAQVKKLQAHIDEHRNMAAQEGERPKEAIKQDGIFFRRRSPLRFFYDWEADTYSDRRWVGEVLLRRVSEVKADERYDKRAREAVGPVDAGVIGPLTNHLDKKDEIGAGAYMPEMAVLYEIVDLVHGKVITYAHGHGDRALRVTDYNLQRLMPAGPYIDACFLEDPLTDRGVCLPSAYEAHQQAATVIETTILAAAKRSVPKMALKGGIVEEEELEEMQQGIPAAIIHLKNMMKGDKIGDVLENIPASQIPAELFLAGDRQKRAIEQFSGLGSAKAAGGDFAKTATASAVQEESTSTLSEDMASVVDNMSERVGKLALRLIRKFYRPEKVMDIVGDAALDYWPQQGFSDSDIVNDRGVTVVPGSSRRNATAVQLKSLTEVYGLLSQDPSIPAELKVDVLGRLLDAAGVFGIDMDSVKKQMQLVQLAQMQGGGGGGAAPPPEGGNPAGPAGRTVRRAESQGEGTQEAVRQGAANVGGGRIPAGGR